MKSICLLVSILIASATFIPVASAQDCGPNCPICSGSGFNTETMLTSRTVFTNVLVFPDAEETLVAGVKLAVSRRFDIGLGYLSKSRDIIWNARALLLLEEDWKPAVIAGIGSVRADASDQSVFITASRNLESNIGVPLRLSVGAATYLSGSGRVYPIGTVSYFYKEKLFPFISFDGKNTNYGISYFIFETFHVGLMYVENRFLGLTTGLRITP